MAKTDFPPQKTLETIIDFDCGVGKCKKKEEFQQKYARISWGGGGKSWKSGGKFPKKWG